MVRNLSAIGRSVGVNLLVLAGTWLVALALVQLAQLTLRHWLGATLAILAAAGVGLLAARRLRAGAALRILLEVVAWMVAEAGAHAAFGIRSVQGQETHLAVMASGLLGVLLGSLAVFHGSRSRGAAPST
jgi:hypothetical protein